ncbi:MAG: hypothetical protein HFJ22_07305 [Clostridia bacterium]|jgi:hypothetical protein|nr:hypothetical protein [Clostridia bacterium]
MTVEDLNGILPKLTDQEMIDAATDIMRVLGISGSDILRFEQSGTVCLHAGGRVIALYGGDKFFEKISAVERERNVKVYAVVHSDIYPVGENFAYLCVSPYAEDIPHLLSRTKDPLSKAVYAYVENVTDDRYSESGYIVAKNCGGVLVRIG